MLLLCVSANDFLDPDLGECSIFHAFGWTATMTPAGICRFLSALLFLNITIGGSISPAAVQAKIIVRRRLSAPFDHMRTSLYPFR